MEEGGVIEQTLDMTQAIGMAPGLASLVVYVGSTDTAILSAMTTHSPLPTTIGCSWGWTPADPSIDDPFFQRMAAQGQNFFAASGDYSTWTSSGNAAAWPADDAYVVSVGGTDLITAGAAGPWASETAWADSGGGISPDKIAIPLWQTAGVINSSNKGSTTYRNGPDVSANSDFTFYVCADQTACTANSYGGTSFAAPMWAGYMALVNQQASQNGNAPLGFINPAIYSIGVGTGYGADFHDVTSGTSGSYSAVTGYDLVTGWGSPNGGLIDALAGAPTSGNFTISASPTSASVAQGAKGTSTITTTVSGGFNSAISLSASGQPTGVTVGFNPTSFLAPGSGTSTMTMAVASTTSTGTYTITITGAGGGTTHTATVSLTVTPLGAFTITASPNSFTVPQGAKGSSTFTTTITTVRSGGFNSAITLSASGLPKGTTATFSPVSIAAPGSGTSTMTLKVGPSTAAGNYTVTVTGTGSGLTNTTTVSLTVK
jgi:kumamolisin